MSLFAMTRQRYEILCALRERSATVAELQDVIGNCSNVASTQVIALRNAGLIEPRGHRASGKRGPRPILYVLTGKGDAAIQAARIPLAVRASAILDLTELEVTE